MLLSEIMSIVIIWKLSSEEIFYLKLFYHVENLKTTTWICFLDLGNECHNGSKLKGYFVDSHLKKK